jgi:hypothetical protein
MNASGLTNRLADATDRIEQVLEGLKDPSPQTLQACAGLIEMACRELVEGLRGRTAITPEAATGDRNALAAAMQLRNKIRQARLLLSNIHHVYVRWGQFLGARTGGYLPGGQAAPVSGAHRLYMRG